MKNNLVYLFFLGKCISKQSLCDGKKDCKHGEDEGGQCGRCEKYECSYRCQDTPEGPHCYCPKDMFLNMDQRTCEYKNLCTELQLCSQFCKQDGVTISCYCATGYTAFENNCILSTEHRNGYLFFVYVIL